MSNVLSDHKQQQVLALGRLVWSLRRIQETTGIRRETASAYLKAAGICAFRPNRPPVPVQTVYSFRSKSSAAVGIVQGSC